MILPDYPISKEEQDQLRRAPLAKRVAEIINAFEGKESFVIGIEGPWGAGKTSFINLILNNLEKDKVEHLVFNPWNFSDETSLLRDFFVQLSQSLEGIVGKKIAKRMRGYAARIADIDLGVSLYGVSINPLKWFGWFAGDLSLNGVRRDLDKDLSGLTKKIVVVIDDIDRLDQKETKLIFKLVKLTANFPNTIFILSYDREQVEKRISDKSAGIDGGDYLRKIVQIGFTLPIPDQEELRGILFKDLDKTIKNLYPSEEILKDKDEQSRWSDLLYHGFGDLFVTVRDIKRYISSLRLDWSIVGTDNVNKIDFLGIEAIRVFAPRFYNAIPANEDLFIQSLRRPRFAANEAKEAEMRRKRYEELLSELVSPREREHISGICAQLFPQLSSYGMHPSEETQEKGMMISHPDRFKFYFQLGIPHGEVSESRVQEVIEAAGNIEDFKAAIIQSKENGNLRRVLRRLLVRRSELGAAKIKNILLSLWALEDEIREDKEAVFDFDDIDTQIMRLGYHALLGIPEGERSQFVADLYREAPRVYHAVHLLHVITDAKRSGEFKLSEEAVAGAKQAMVQKIRGAEQNGSLKNEKNLIAILFRWQEWDSREAVFEFIKNWTSTREGLLAFLQACVHRVLSSNGNYNDLNPQTISDLYSLDDVKAAVDAIPEGDVAGMTDKQKEAISLFKKRPREW
jgi:predicted KAP-like P-loop ATPase